MPMALRFKKRWSIPMGVVIVLAVPLGWFIVAANQSRMIAERTNDI